MKFSVFVLTVFLAGISPADVKADNAILEEIQQLQASILSGGYIGNDIVGNGHTANGSACHEYIKGHLVTEVRSRLVYPESFSEIGYEITVSEFGTGDSLIRRYSAALVYYALIADLEVPTLVVAGGVYSLECEKQYLHINGLTIQPLTLSGLSDG